MDQQQQNYQNQQPPQTIIIKKGMGFWGVFAIILSIIFLVCIVLSTIWYAQVGPLSRLEWQNMSDNINWVVHSQNSWSDDWDEAYNSFGSSGEWYAGERDDLEQSRRDRIDAITDEHHTKYEALQESFDNGLISENSYKTEAENLEKWQEKELGEIEKWFQKEMNAIDQEENDERNNTMNDSAANSGDEWRFDGMYPAGETLISQSYSGNSISELHIGVAAAKISITKSADEKAHIAVKAERNAQYRARFKMGVSDGRLTLLQRNHARGHYNIEVSLPENRYEQIQLETASGSLKVDGLESDSIVLKSVSGSVNVKAACRTIRSESMSGSVNLDLSGAESIHVSAVSGSTNIKTNVKAPNIDVDSMSGSTNVVVPQDASFTYSVKGVSGSLRVFDQQGMGGLSGIIADGDGAITIKSVSGRTEIVGEPMKSEQPKKESNTTMEPQQAVEPATAS